MLQEKTILLTGVTGLLGSELLDRILGDESKPRVLLLLRGEPTAVGRKFQTLIDGLDYAEFASRIEPVLGDLQHPGLGLDPLTRSAITEKLTHVIHAAASIHFEMPYAEAHEINYCGTVRVYDLAAEARHLEAFAHVSTAYVAGRRTGVIAEQELEHDAGFVNDYERTKYEGEHFCKSRMQTLPIAVYRTTTMIGDSTSGVVRQFNYFHAALRAMYLCQVPFVPGDLEYRVDVIPQDWAAEVIHFLALKKFRAGATYHVCSGAEHSFSLAELVQATCAIFAESEDARPCSGTAPAIISLDEFHALLARSDGLNNGNTRELRLPRQFSHFISELLLPKSFASEQLRRDFTLRADTAPDIRAYYSKVIRYCLEKHWGREQRSGVSAHA
jgi:long-chain acyl-CoA synthetase